LVISTRPRGAETIGKEFRSSGVAGVLERANEIHKTE
jgi:hypothetical protein